MATREGQSRIGERVYDQPCSNDAACTSEVVHPTARRRDCDQRGLKGEQRR